MTAPGPHSHLAWPLFTVPSPSQGQGDLVPTWSWAGSSTASILPVNGENEDHEVTAN